MVGFLNCNYKIRHPSLLPNSEGDIHVMSCHGMYLCMYVCLCGWMDAWMDGCTVM